MAKAKITVKPNPGDLPTPLKVGGKDPAFKYRFILDEKPRIAEMLTRGWKLCTKADNPNVETAYLRDDGLWGSGDTILAKMPMAKFKEHQARVRQRTDRQMKSVETSLYHELARLGVQADGDIKTSVSKGLPPIPKEEE